MVGRALRACTCNDHAVTAKRQGLFPEIHPLQIIILAPTYRDRGCPMRNMFRIWTVLMGLFLIASVTALPARATQETWTDGFTNGSFVQQATNVTIGGGRVILGPAPISREGLAFGSSAGASSPAIVLVGSIYYLYYSTGGPGSTVIGVATSSDGSTWRDRGTVIPTGFQGANDSAYVLYETVVVVGATFHMWYSGQNGATGIYQIEHATSADGLNWTGRGTALSPEIVGGTAESTYAPAVVVNNGIYTMWYTTFNGTDTALWVATSSDGGTWVRRGPVMGPQPGTEANGPRMPTVVLTSSGYRMWYVCSGAQDQICRARSGDGMNWTREGVVLSPNPALPGESGVVALPSALEVNPGFYRIWYAARGSGVAEIYTGLTTGGPASPGRLISVRIPIPKNMTWLWLEIQKVEPSGTAVAVTIVDGSTGLPITGYIALAGSNVSLAGIDPTAVASIRLEADLASTGANSPILERWSVVYGTPVPQPSTVAFFPIPAQYLIALAVLAGAGIAGGGYWLTLKARRDTQRPR